MSTNTKVAKTENAEEDKIINSLRASSWDEFHGQKTVKKNLKVAIQAAKKRQEAIEHILLYGPPGLGKTTLAHIIARDMGVNIRITSGPAIERAGDLASILTNLEPKDILFIDEIHRLSKVVEETLYPSMEDYALDIVIGKGPSARTLRLDLPQFTIIGATTRIGLLSSPMRDRFGVINRLSFYDPEDINQILESAEKKLKISLNSETRKELSKRCRGTPRIALRLLKRVRDLAQIEDKLIIDSDILKRSLDMLEVDSVGLDASDQRLILTIIDKFSGGPVGIGTLAAALSEDVGTVEEVLEPYLMQIGFLKRSPRGRVATPKSYSHFGRKLPHNLSQENLLTKFL